MYKNCFELYFIGFLLFFVFSTRILLFSTRILYHKISNLSIGFSKKIQDINKCCDNKQVKIAGKGYGDNVGRIGKKKDVSKMGGEGLGRCGGCSAHSLFASLDRCRVRNPPPPINTLDINYV